MPRGKPGTGPYAGRGLQHKTAVAKDGRTINAHYLRYTKREEPKRPSAGSK
jgi:hypothetical protein